MALLARLRPTNIVPVRVVGLMSVPQVFHGLSHLPGFSLRGSRARISMHDLFCTSYEAVLLPLGALAAFPPLAA